MADETNLRTAGEENWAGKPCEQCGNPATRHASLYDKPEGETIDLNAERAVGDVFFHDGGVKCVRLKQEYGETVGLTPGGSPGRSLPG
jgi:hypothetical protein